jgi:hypothetical protein
MLVWCKAKLKRCKLFRLRHYASTSPSAASVASATLLLNEDLGRPLRITARALPASCTTGCNSHCSPPSHRFSRLARIPPESLKQSQSWCNVILTHIDLSFSSTCFVLPSTSFSTSNTSIDVLSYSIESYFPSLPPLARTRRPSEVIRSSSTSPSSSSSLSRHELVNRT